MREVNESFVKHEEFKNWVLSQSKERLQNVFKIKIDNGPAEYNCFIIHESINDLILICPFCYYGPSKDNYYKIDYPLKAQVDWYKLEIISEMTEEEVLRFLTQDPDAKISK